MSDDIFNESNEVQSAWVKFNVPLEDKVSGTLISKSTRKSTMPGKEGQMQNIYELKADMGTWHALDDKKHVIDTPVTVESGQYITIGGTNVIDRQMKNVRVGQKVGLKYIEEQPSKTKGFAAAKIVKVYAPKNPDGSVQMDEEFLRQLSVDNFDSTDKIF